MSLFDAIRARSIRNKIKLTESKQYLKMLESMPSFAKDNDEDDWFVIGSSTNEHGEYTEQDLKSLQLRAQNIYYTSPIARGVINTLCNFIIGRNFKILPEATDEKIEQYWEDFWDDNKMFLKVKELVKRTFKSGEIFIRFFEGTNPDRPIPIIRFLRASKIYDPDGKYSYGIKTDSQDVEKPVEYCYNYVDVNGSPAHEWIPAEQIIHIKIMVDSDVKRGISFLVGIIKYINDYTEWLNDRKTLNKIRTIFNLIGKPTGATSPATFASQFTAGTQKASSGGSPTYNKKLPKSGSVILSKGTEYEFKSLNLSAADTAHDGRAMTQMIVAGSNLAEYMVTGDASNANYASTMVSESPAVRSFEAWQDFFSYFFKEIYKKVIDMGLKNNVVPTDYEKISQEWDPIKKEAKEIKERIPTTGKCIIEFPVLIHRDIEKDTKALAIQENAGYVSKETVSSKLGYDYEEEQKKIIKELQEDEKLAMENDDHNHENPKKDEEDPEDE